MNQPPEYFVLDWKEGTRLTPKPTKLFIEVDSLGKQEVIALVNDRKELVLYTADIATPVCADGECKLMNIKFYWTLLGEYAGFDSYPELPLTKHDHDEFIKEDYQKLHTLLMDDNSVLGRRSIDQLVEKPTMRTVNGVDALSGATIAEVKESVVNGALYSCYMAWHLVYGDIQKKLKVGTLSVLNENMIIDMLYSNNQEYRLFALENIDGAMYHEHYLQIAKIFETSAPLVRSIIAKELTTVFKNAPNLQKPFWEAFDKIDLGSRSLLVKYLKEAPNYALTILSSKLDVMSKNQLKTFLLHLSQKTKLNPKVYSNLKEFADSDKDTYAYLAKDHLEDSGNKKTN